jgi:hypothetical protein
MPNHTSRIAEIRGILRQGADSVTVDGTSVRYDLRALKQELRELEAEDDELRHRKPRVSSINLGNS